MNAIRLFIMLTGLILILAGIYRILSGFTLDMTLLAPAILIGIGAALIFAVRKK
jgi:hypothetical protein